MKKRLLFAALCLQLSTALAGNQIQEAISARSRAFLAQMLGDDPIPAQSLFLALPDASTRNRQVAILRAKYALTEDPLQFLATVRYEARRAGLEPELVLALIQVESNFRKYAVSSAGAKGLMQVMPFWIGDIGNPTDNLFHLRTNIRYGCAILRYYLDIEHGDLNLALGRYNGSRGQPEYPQAVYVAYQKWQATTSFQ